jgi:ribonuclease P protein component
MNKEAKRLHSRHLVILWKENSFAVTRLGITITRKVAGAVGRNHFKRRVREAFRLGGDKIPQGLDLVVIGKKNSDLLTQRQVAKEMYQALSQLAHKGAMGESTQSGPFQ